MTDMRWKSLSKGGICRSKAAALSWFVYFLTGRIARCRSPTTFYPFRLGELSEKSDLGEKVWKPVGAECCVGSLPQWRGLPPEEWPGNLTRGQSLWPRLLSKKEGGGVFKDIRWFAKYSSKKETNSANNQRWEGCLMDLKLGHFIADMGANKAETCHY